MPAGFREAAGKHAGQVLHVPARRAGGAVRARVRAAGRRRGVRRAHRDRVRVHTRGRRAQVPQLGRVAPREPDADRHADDTRARARRGHRGQGDEHVLQLADGCCGRRRRDGRGPAQRRAVRPAGGGARGELAEGRQQLLHRLRVRRRRLEPPDRLTATRGVPVPLTQSPRHSRSSRSQRRRIPCRALHPHPPLARMHERDHTT